MKFLISPVTTEDTAVVRDLMERTIRRSVTNEEPVLGETLRNVNGNLDYWLSFPEKCVHLKAASGSHLAGVILVKDYWNLCSLFVDPECHGRGIGRALVEAAAGLCRGRSPRNALLLNAATNAVPFYGRLGFLPRETIQPLPSGFQALQRPL